MKLLIVIAFCFFFYPLQAQKTSYPSIRSPLDIPLKLSGTFCELRGNHFHAGIDLRTQGKEGLKVYAVESGFVSRIKVSSNGYGNALYLSHPNGYTSVYAHLQSFNKAIEDFTKNIQYHLKQSEIDTFLPPLLLMVNQEEVIALSGNSGGSQAPHLHFEMRKTNTQAPYNPKLFGLFIIDTLAPYPGKLLIQNFDNDDLFSEPLALSLEKKNEFFTTLHDTIEVNAKKIGLSIFTEDRMEDSGNSNGIYTLQMKLNGKIYYGFQFEKLDDFDETRKISGHYEQAIFKQTGIKYHRCYQLPGYDLSVIFSNENRGYIFLQKDETVFVELLIQDLCFNILKINLLIHQNENALTFKILPKPYNKILPYTQSNIFKTADLTINFPEDIFYEDLFFTFSESPRNPNRKIFSKKFQIHTETDPCRKSFYVSMKIDSFPEFLKDKALIVRESLNGSKIPIKCKWKDEQTISFSSSVFGWFYLSIDTSAPIISPVNIYENKLLKQGQKVQFKITDNLSGIKDYQLYVNGNWVLTTFDRKNNLLWHTFEEQLPRGEHELALIVIDDVNNKSFFKTKFRIE